MRLAIVMSFVAACRFPTLTGPTPPTETDPPPDTTDTAAPTDTATPTDTAAPTDTGAPLDTGDTAIAGVVWRDIAAGTYFGVDSGDSGSVFDCETVLADLLTNQAALDAFTAEYAYGIDLTGTVDFLTEVAVGGSMECSHGGEDIVVVGVHVTGPDTLHVDYEIVQPYAFYDAAATTFNVIAVSGTHWTSVTSTSTVVQFDSGDTGP